MPENRDRNPGDAARPAVERLLERKLEGHTGVGRRLSGRALQSQRSVEAYLNAGVRPRWMERVIEIDGATKRELRRLERAHAALAQEHRGDPAGFAERWRAVVQRWRFEELNELIRQHNDWYPIERDLPMDPRTRDYVLLSGRSYRREELGPEWVLARLPAELPLA